MPGIGRWNSLKSSPSHPWKKRPEWVPSKHVVWVIPIFPILMENITIAMFDHRVNLGVDSDTEGIQCRNNMKQWGSQKSEGIRRKPKPLNWTGSLKPGWPSDHPILRLGFPDRFWYNRFNIFGWSSQVVNAGSETKVMPDWFLEATTRSIPMIHTVDGRNPAPADRYFIPLFIGFQPSKVVQDFWKIHSRAYHRVTPQVLMLMVPEILGQEAFQLLSLQLDGWW